jgi:uncharacterized protein
MTTSPALKAILDLIDVRRPVFEVIILHGALIASKALSGARKVRHLNPDFQFIYEASLLHDIGIFLTNAPDIDCHGKAPYLQHGMLGAGLMRKAGLPKHAKVCERHVGVCISKKEIIEKNLPLAKKNYFPETVEEKLIAWADKFYSKIPGKFLEEKSVEAITTGLSKFGQDKVNIFMEWQRTFG